MVGRVQENEASQTAKTAAAARAAHLLVDHEPFLFVDDLAYRLLGAEAEQLVGYHRESGDHPILAGARAQAVCRSRYAENRVLEGKAEQYVLLGAGLDTFAYRIPGNRRVFEVDHPATQEWKCARLAEAGIEATAIYVPMDFENDSVVKRLVEAGFDQERPAIVSWLGVTMYLTRPAIGHVLGELSTLASGSELVVDHILPTALRDDAGRYYAEQVAQVSAGWGEPWLSCLSPRDMADLLTEHGFAVVEHVTQREIGLWQRTDVLRPAALSVLTTARKR